MERDRTTVLTLESGEGLTAAALDMLGREWVTSLGTLWTREQASGHGWTSVWKDPGLEAPFVSLMADAGLIVAMTADGAVIEGRDTSTGFL